ncbi:cytochrome c [Bacillus sp. DTU_2020_1000418_1_SI_GHA_SEK_038]|uniref:cytochrome c551 n=1 Tax=Bacillus sp. DTU_2020_1000418_1_SI_GHA_SEK_038 TaxID=3077585 RepID=UPI0028F0322D|nr:cytochrome c [Bacillus sp. DTU_2020_1000418_1_SI_GHA_SEK_038]WNS75067.1 cytochrome c [Bacillus sp. DTU_2020_1000418_1_SI_GHA_SEK_038]
MKKKLLALLMGTSLVLAACGGGDDNAADEKDTGTTNGGETTTAGAGDAQKLYDQKCSSCHGANLEGTVGPKLSDAGAHFTKEEIEGIIANGQGAMPAGLLKGDEAAQVSEWLAAKK